MKKNDDQSANYVKMMVLVFVGFAAFIVALVAGYFGFVGLFFGQAIVEQDVFEDKYKYTCNLANGTPDKTDAGICNAFNYTNPLPSWEAYEESRDILNSLIPKFLIATFVIFSLLGLVFLFLALRSAGLVPTKSSNKKGDLY